MSIYVPREDYVAKKKKEKKQCISHQNKTPNLKQLIPEKKKKKTTSCKDNHIFTKTIPIAYTLISLY